MNYRYLKLAGMWARIVLITLSIIAFATFLLWQYGGGLVNQFDAYLVKTYQEYHQEHLNYAITNVSQNPAEGIVVLEKLLDDLSETQKLDRLDRIKRTAFDTIIKTLHSSDRNEEALFWAERWVEFDDRDLFAQVWRARLMRKMQADSEKGWLLISEWYRKVPDSGLVVNEYAEYLIERGDLTSAYLAVYNVFMKQDSLTGQKWQLYWDTGKGFNAGQMQNISPTIDVNNKLSVMIDLSQKAKSLRIDPPANSRIKLVNPILVINKADQKGHAITENQLGLSQMTRAGNALLTSGGSDPYFYWSMSGSELPAEKLYFVCTVEESPPDVLNKIIKQSDPDVMENDLLGRHELEAVKMFRIISAKQRSAEISSLFENAVFELFWKGSGEGFSQQRKIRVPLIGTVEKNSYTFDTIFHINSHAEKLRIDFPSTIGADYTIEEVELTGDGWTYQIDLNKIDARLMNMIAHDGAHFKVLGNDPYFVLSVPFKERIIQSVVVRGSVL